MELERSLRHWRNHFPDHLCGPYASCPEDIVADIVQSKLLADCIFVKRWPEVALTSRDLFSLAGAGWKSWISDTIVDTYIDYMRLSMDISQNVTICNSQFLTMLQMYFSYPPSGNGETVEKPVYIDLEQEDANSILSEEKATRGKKRGIAESRKRGKSSSTKENDKLFSTVIVEFRKKLKLTQPLAEIDTLVVPICNGSHWYLLQIFGKDRRGRLLNSDIHIKLGGDVCTLIDRWWRCDNLHEGLNAK